MQFCSDENIDNGVVNHLMILGKYPVPKLWPRMIKLTCFGRNTGFILLWRASYLPRGSNAQIVASLEKLKYILPQNNFNWRGDFIPAILLKTKQKQKQPPPEKQKKESDLIWCMLISLHFFLHGASFSWCDRCPSKIICQFSYSWHRCHLSPYQSNFFCEVHCLSTKLFFSFLI